MICAFPGNEAFAERLVALALVGGILRNRPEQLQAASAIGERQQALGARDVALLFMAWLRARGFVIGLVYVPIYNALERRFGT